MTIILGVSQESSGHHPCPCLSLKMRIPILDYHQKDSDKPLRYEKWSKAAAMLRRGEVYWTDRSETVLKMIPPAAERGLAYDFVAPTLPPVELPGIRVVDLPIPQRIPISMSDFIQGLAAL